MFQDTFKGGMNNVRNFGTDDILGALGLQRRSTFGDVIVPALGIFAAGAVVGGAVALLLAPKSGDEMRRDLASRADDLRHRVGNAAKDALGEARQAIGEAREAIEEKELPFNMRKRAEGTESNNHLEHGMK
ncbi:MAG TPA: YtxH domain-containing protein [Polyangiaceae bacterium]|jgi:gas vesicle protein|nr:YtxH domain-containing protein [Polyangiaceae bacterium]